MAKKKSESNGAPRSPAKPSVPVESFVVAWQACATLAEAKEKLGDGASSRAARLRKEGVKLKEMAGSRKKIDVAALNALIGG